MLLDNILVAGLSRSSYISSKNIIIYKNKKKRYTELCTVTGCTVTGWTVTGLTVTGWTVTA